MGETQRIHCSVLRLKTTCHFNFKRKTMFSRTSKIRNHSRKETFIMTLNGAGKDSKYVDENAPPDWVLFSDGLCTVGRPTTRSTRINQINPIQAVQDFGLFPGKISSERAICSWPDLTDPLLQDRHIKKISNLTGETYAGDPHSWY